MEKFIVAIGGLILAGLFCWENEPVNNIKKRVSRGVRNNNPGNIKISSNNWVGKIVESDDSVFEQFIEPEYGIRALSKIILKYFNDYNLKSVQEIIDRYAPGNENDTVSYVSFICHKIDIAKDDILSMPEDLPGLIEAIIEYENGYSPYSYNVIAKGIQLSGVQIA